MRRAHTVEQVRTAEAALLAGLPDGVLMQRAAAGLAHAVAELLGRVYGARVLLLVGAGGNGGDALYAGAGLARRGASVEAVLLDPDRTHPAAAAAFRGAGGRVVAEPRGRYAVVVDGIVGIGGSGPLREAAAVLVDRLRDTPFVAVDTPSGVEVDTGRVSGAHVQAALTVTFGALKPCHLLDPGAAACGSVELVDLGLDLPAPVAEALQADDVARLLPRPAADAHKYTRGVVGVRAGSEQYRGAGVLSVAGAACGLAGMVRYLPAPAPPAGPDRGTGVADLVQAAFPEVVVGAGRVQAWVVGSGGGPAAGAQLREALADGVPVVVDADALAAVEGPLAVPAVLTPHAGELARMLDTERAEVEADQLGSARAAAQRYGAVVLLKGRRSVVAGPDGRVRVNTVGPPWLATAGAGDVLGGVVGALLAAGLDPLDAAGVGAWLHGSAAGQCRPGGPVTAGEVARAVPDVCARLLGTS
ncbi:MAG: NAD(P)H-hydrate epimerase / ADP-dependent (S)-NAD(P)H-hydrate dehydratase [uncultured Nocardioidaceae bacterium]|uniref:Bifunctional NAD(P)H-hydrate repair enzyme n=1 Tax=uncultured Nocardioidaceae bacterium TaxID=253824 RepID=A0A6J4M3G9_9ACTN|nr:MAG: NAD(P)H-hydrate epimerase / ADP-dependent (S)-NAD(P)H-hydrate dehydratase [uncultured Nocardioidaceae bacterium]